MSTENKQQEVKLGLPTLEEIQEAETKRLQRERLIKEENLQKDILKLREFILNTTNRGCPRTIQSTNCYHDMQYLSGHLDTIKYMYKIKPVHVWDGSQMYELSER
jgi:hypothetical protein